MKSSVLRSAIFAALIASPAAAGATDSPEALAFFETSIRPVLVDHCQECHSGDHPKGSLRFDSRESLVKGGDSGPAIVPGDAEKSLLLKALTHTDRDLKMPPAKKGGKLPDKIIADFTAWVKAGAPWTKLPDNSGAAAPQEKHWSLKPLAKPPLPGPDKNPVDAFIHAELVKRGIAFSPEADRRTLIRRVYYDLTGLPPSPEEVTAFESDKDPAAWEKLVSHLLDSPRYGERWARHWLDTIHFADSHGYEHDLERTNAWPFRDYVINALNSDIPWAQFIREQLAADYYYPDKPEMIPAIGYLGAGLFDMSTFATAVDTFDYLDRDDLVTQTMAAFTSTTANCARCHAHKFDPISQQDYYALQAVFAGVIKGEIPYDADPAVAHERQRWMALVAAADKQDAKILLTPENSAITAEWVSKSAGAAKWQVLKPETYVSSDGAMLTLKPDSTISSGGARPERDTCTIVVSSGIENATALRLNVLTDDALPVRGPGRADNGNLHLSEVALQIFEPGAAKPRDVKIRRATADFNQEGWTIEMAIDGNPKTAWGIHPMEGQPHTAVFELAEKLTLKDGARLAIILRQIHGGGHIIGAFNLAATSDPVEQAAVIPAAVETALTIPEKDRTEAQRIALAAYAVRLTAQAALSKLPPQSRVYAAAPSVDVLSGEPVRTAKSLPGPKVVHVLHRGEFDKPREVAEPGALSSMTHLPGRFALKNPANEAERRAALAEWIAHPDNVLTWRSIVNRVWHYHFGRGLCDTPSDFGKMGGVPSHPDLLNWLAVWFRDDAKGSLKKLHYLIATSQTYRQSSAFNAAPAQQDGDNRLLWRQNVHRLDADSIRDFTLAASGHLDLTMGGPGVQHFTKSPGRQGTPFLDYTAWKWDNPAGGRRSIYRFVWRGIADPFMEALDFPDLGLLSSSRGFSASSLQALTLFNNDFILFHSAALAARVEKEFAETDCRVARAVRLVWLRDPSADEVREYSEFVRLHGLPAFCRLLLNSNEFLFVN